MSKDLRTYLNQLQESQPEDIKVVDREMDRKWEVTALIEKLRRSREHPNFPAVLFTNVKGSRFPLLINLCASYKRLAFGIDATVQTMVTEYARREATSIPPLPVAPRLAYSVTIVWTVAGIAARGH